MSNHKYLNLEGLSLYTEHVKQYIDNGDSEFLTCTWNGASRYMVEGTHERPVNNFKKITLFVKDTSPEGSKRLTITWDDNTSASFVFMYGTTELTAAIQGGTILEGILMATPSIDGGSAGTRTHFFIKGDFHVPYTSDEIKQINWE